MSLIRLIKIRIFFLVAILLIAVKASGQWGLADIDTSDYFPPIYKDADNLNLMIAASKGYSSEIIRLVRKGADINAETQEGATPLIFAVINNKPVAVITLLAYKPNINKPTSNNETPLMIAVKNRFFNVAEALIRGGADMDKADNFGATPLHHASLNGYLDMADLLIYYNANLNVKTPEGTTPLLAAIWAGYTDISDLLVQNGANTEELDNEGFTPFLLAAYYGDTIVMDILYKHGTNIYAKNKANNNALSLAIASGNTSAAEYLLNIGDKWEDQGSAVVNLYSVAAKYRRTEMINLLKSHGIPGKLKHELDQFSISASSKLSLHSQFAGINLSFKEPYINGGFTLGCDTKLWYSRVLIKQPDNIIYQYMYKGSIAYAGLFKDFALTDLNDRFNYLLSASLTGGYSFGNNLKGTLISSANKVLIIPSISFKMTKLSQSYYIGIEYNKTVFYHISPVWIRIGASYNYFFDNVRTRIKPIKWY